MLALLLVAQPGPQQKLGPVQEKPVSSKLTATGAIPVEHRVEPKLVVVVGEYLDPYVRLVPTRTSR